MNMGMRILTTRDLERLRKPEVKDLMDPSLIQIANKELLTLVLPDTVVPEMIVPTETIAATPEDLRQLGVAQPEAEAPQEQQEQPQPQQQGMPVNVVLQNTMQQMQPQQQAFNYRVVGEAQPSSSIEADDLSFAPLQMPPQMQQQQPAVNINIQSQQPQQPQTNALLIPSAIPGAPPTLVVDTSPPAMQATGLPPLPMQQPRPNNVNRRTPPRSASQSQPQVNNGPSVAASTVPPATKVNVIKQG